MPFTLSINVFVAVTFPSAVTPKKNSGGSDSGVLIEPMNTMEVTKTQSNKTERNNRAILRLKKNTT